MNTFFRLSNDQGIALGKRIADACEKFAIVSAGVGVYDAEKVGVLALCLGLPVYCVKFGYNVEGKQMIAWGMFAALGILMFILGLIVTKDIKK